MRGSKHFNFKSSSKKQPFKLKLIKGIFIVFQLVVIGVSSLQLFLNLNNINTFVNQTQDMKVASDSVVHLNMIGFYARLTQMAE